MNDLIKFLKRMIKGNKKQIKTLEKENKEMKQVIKMEKEKKNENI